MTLVAVLIVAATAPGAVVNSVTQGTVLTVAQGTVLTVAQGTVLTVAQGAMSNIEEPRQAVVRTAAEWQALWKQHDPGGTAPPVDFSQSLVAAVFLGSRPTAGFTAEIIAVKTEGTRTVVEFRERQPPADAFVAQVLTSPFHIVRLPSTAGSIEFRRLK
jgi:hypothetical protein